MIGKIDQQLYLVQIRSQNGEQSTIRAYLLTKDQCAKLTEIANSEDAFCGVTSILSQGPTAIEVAYNNIKESPLTQTKKSKTKKRKNHSNLLDSVSTQSQSSKENYHWNDFEEMQFIKVFPKYNHKWTNLAKEIATRTSAQCRSKGQKYLSQLKELQHIVSKLIINQLALTTKDLTMIKKYEYLRKNIIKTLVEEKGNVNLLNEHFMKFIPPYILMNYENQIQEVSWEKQLMQIAQSVSDELAYYEKSEKDSMEPKKKKRKLD